jgi:hypothetical protein
VGLLLWRQTDHRLPGEAPALDVPVAAQPAVQKVDPALATEPSAPPPQPEVQRELPPVRAERIAPPAAEKSEALAQAPSTQPAPAPSPPPPPVITRDTSADEADQVEMEEVQVTGTRIVGERRMVGPRATVPAAAGGAALREQSSGAELVQQYFPTQYQSSTPRRVWLARDNEGAVLGTGELGAAEQLPNQLEPIRRALEVDELTVESVQSVSNARGQQVELSLLLAR